MARSDLLLNLVKSKAIGDEKLFRQTVEAIILEETSKQHHVLAKQLSDALKDSSNDRNSKSFISSPSTLQNLLIEQLPQKRLDDLILPVDVLSCVEEIIEEYQRADLLRTYNIEPRHRILLSGPPGNGKTSLAEAIAESLSIPLLTIRYDGLITSFLGETNQKLRQVFDYVKTNRCVLFFDEFETIGKERGDAHDTGEIKRVVSSLLLQIDSLPSHVIVVAASNHPELLDRAVWRRFQLKLELNNPNLKDIERWLKSFEERTSISFGSKKLPIAKALVGKCFSDVESFALQVFRRFILEKPDSTLEKVLQRQFSKLSKQSVSKPAKIKNARK
jgi:SpoVK/Ycf46/Vps4 family AAA+-type ATPase